MLALSSREEEGEERGCLATFFNLEERGVYWPKFLGSLGEGLFSLRIVTFLKQIYSRGRVEGEIGSLSVKIESEFKSEGSNKEGASLGLEGKVAGR